MNNSNLAAHAILMGNIPRTTKLTLKRIVENLPAIPPKGFNEETPKLTAEQKKRLMEMAAMYENFGECLKNEEAIVNSAKGLSELVELASQYAVNECGDWFQQNIVQKDMQNLKKRIAEYNKVAKEAYARIQELGVAYQDIGHVLGRYYNLQPAQAGSGPAPQTGKGPIEMEEDMVGEGKQLCAWCGKQMGTVDTEKDSHGICSDCSAQMMKDTGLDMGGSSGAQSPEPKPANPTGL